MSSTKLKKDKKIKPKVEKKLAKLINDSDSGSESEHELSHYLKDRVKLMKEVIHILRPKKIKSMAPDCIKVSLNTIFLSFIQIIGFCLLTRFGSNIIDEIYK